MKKLIGLSLMVTSAAAWAGPPTAKFALGDSEKGKVVFTQFCLPCHGESGKGDGPAGAALTPKPADFTDAARAAKITDEEVYRMVKEGGQPFNKSPLMVSWKGTLNDDQMKDVAAYIRTFSKKKK